MKLRSYTEAPDDIDVDDEDDLLVRCELFREVVRDSWLPLWQPEARCRRTAPLAISCEEVWPRAPTAASATAQVLLTHLKMVLDHDSEFAQQNATLDLPSAFDSVSGGFQSSACMPSVLKTSRGHLFSGRA